MNLRQLALLALPFASMLFNSGCSGQKDLFAPVEAPEISNRFEVKELWDSSTGGTAGFYSQLNPAVSGNTVYAASRNGKVYAFDLSKGSKLWSTDLGDEEENDNKRSARLSGGVSVTAGRLAVGSENGYVYILNSKDGALQWKHYIGAEVIAKPQFADDGSKLFVLDSLGRLYAFDLLNKGRQLWISGDSSSNLHLRAQSNPVVIGSDIIAAGFSNGRVMLINQNDGSIVDQIAVGQNTGNSDLDRISDVVSTPLVLNGKLYATAFNSGFVQYDFSDRAVTAKLNYNSSKDVAFDSEYFVITGENGHVYCVRRDNNEEVWENANLSYRNVSAPAVYGNYAVVGDYEGYLYFISMQDGTIQSKFDTDDSAIQATPLVVGNSLLVLTSKGNLYKLYYDPNNLAAQKQAQSSQEQIFGEQSALAALKASSSEDLSNSGGITASQLEQRRAMAIRLVNEMNARERAIEAQRREYERQKAEHERRVAEYEQQRREAVSGFGIMPGVKSDADSKDSSVDNDTAPLNQEDAESSQEKSSSFGVY